MRGQGSLNLNSTKISGTIAVKIFHSKKKFSARSGIEVETFAFSSQGLSMYKTNTC